MAVLQNWFVGDEAPVDWEEEPWHVGSPPAYGDDSEPRVGLTAAELSFCDRVAEMQERRR